MTASCHFDENPPDNSAENVSAAAETCRSCSFFVSSCLYDRKLVDDLYDLLQNIQGIG